MQESLNALQKWSETTGFKLSPTKTKCILFSRGGKQSQRPELYLNEQELPVTQTVKILGLTLDDKLTWKPHINQLKDDCKRRLNIIKTLAKRNWGADQQFLIRTYNALVRPKLDYGSIVYNSAKLQTLKKLSPIHNAGLKLALGAFCSSPVSSILAETNENPLDIKRIQLSLVTITKLASTPENPAHDSTFKGNYLEQYLKRPNYLNPLYFRNYQLLNELNLRLPKIALRRPHIFPMGNSHRWYKPGASKTTKKSIKTYWIQSCPRGYHQ